MVIVGVANKVLAPGVKLTCLSSVLVDLRDVKEVRPGKHSKDFEKWPEEAKKVDLATCFIILYGQEFRLKTLSVAGEIIQR